MSLTIKSFFDSKTSTLTYVVSKGGSAIIIDPVLDYNASTSKISFTSNQKVIDYIYDNKLEPSHILETHVHADHLSGAAFLKVKFPKIKIAIGSKIGDVQNIFSKKFNTNVLDSAFDILLEEGIPLVAGEIHINTIFTPGHTPVCCCFLIEDCLFTGDALFMPDSGTGRCDFPSGSAEELYKSIQEKIYTLPETIRTFTGHDYQPGGRSLAYESTIGIHKNENIHLKATTNLNDYVEFRTTRDATLNFPQLLYPSLQVNIKAGLLPESEENGIAYLKFPLDLSDL